ncbi:MULTISPECIES: hypothetical protein [unclassified Duganella]|uniref:hypothetical protein n=1 Tax=unclassified Duganella TaxID=2636909 RepID=UPI000E34CDD6|nr:MULTISPECIES: hypothetical protein [unclassified Duganella]RFP09209.1 hypothetical protein D0T23_26185 [Duganella sp. BJB475]RFP25435.1 hypothetical protein D0T21_28270 [Duganella sp. BJB476]
MTKITGAEYVTSTGSEHITPAGGNIFADLGFPPSEAEKLHADAVLIIALKLALKDKAGADIPVTKTLPTQP